MFNGTFLAKVSAFNYLMMKYIFLFFVFFYCGNNFAQNKIDWVDFDELETKLQQKPKPILIYFYADWCAYCKKMDRYAFKNKKVIKTLSEDFYAVKMNAETKDTIVFEETTFINDEVETSRNPTHQLAKLLAGRKDQAFTLPAIVFLNKDFKVIDRKFTYLTSEKLLRTLEKLR